MNINEYLQKVKNKEISPVKTTKKILEEAEKGLKFKQDKKWFINLE